MKARSPEKSTNVSADEDGYLSRNMTIRANLDTQFLVSPANNKIVKERSWINPITSKIMKQPLEPDTDAQLYDERIVAVRQEPSLHVEHQRVVTDGVEVASRGAQAECVIRNLSTIVHKKLQF